MYVCMYVCICVYVCMYVCMKCIHVCIVCMYVNCTYMLTGPKLFSFNDTKDDVEFSLRAIPLGGYVAFPQDLIFDKEGFYCMYVCMYVCTVCVYVCITTRSLSMCMYVSMYVRMYACICIQFLMYISVHS